MTMHGNSSSDYAGPYRCSWVAIVLYVYDKKNSVSRKKAEEAKRLDK